MADIRVERKGGTRAWHWALLALVVIALALLLLYQAGYIGVALQLDATAPQPLAQLLYTATSQEVLHG